MTAPAQDMPNRCYVYGIAVDDGSGPVLRYVGKATHGKRRSRFKQHMNEARKRVMARQRGERLKPHKLYNCLAKAIEQGHAIFEVIIADGLDDEAAFRLERQLIAGMSPDLKWNVLDGGQGLTSADGKRRWEDAEFRGKVIASLRPWNQSAECSAQLKAKRQDPSFEARRLAALKAKRQDPEYRAYRKARYQDPEVRAKMSSSAKGRDKSKLWTRPVITPQGTFRSGREAAAAYGITNSAASIRAKRQTHGWQFADEKLRPAKPHLKMRPVVTPQGVFPSVAAAAAAHGIPETTASRRAKHQLYGWRFAGCDPIPKDSPDRLPRRAVVTPTGYFESVAAAAKALGISADTAYARAKNQRKGWYFADENPKAKSPKPRRRRYIRGVAAQVQA